MMEPEQPIILARLVVALDRRIRREAERLRRAGRPLASLKPSPGSTLALIVEHQAAAMVALLRAFPGDVAQAIGLVEQVELEDAHDLAILERAQGEAVIH